MTTILDYLECQITNNWNILTVDDLWEICLVVAPTNGTVDEIKDMIALPNCVIYVIVDDLCKIEGLSSINTNEVNQIPPAGLLMLLERRLLPSKYKYGIIHKIS